MHDKSKKDTRAIRILWSELHSIEHTIGKISRRDGDISDFDKEKVLSYIEILSSDPYAVTRSLARKSLADIAIFSAMVEEEINISECIREIAPDSLPVVLVTQITKVLQDWVDTGKGVPENTIRILETLTRGLIQRSQLALMA